MSDKRHRCCAEGPACPRCEAYPMYCSGLDDHDGPHSNVSTCGTFHWSDSVDDSALLRSVLSEYLAGNRIVDGYWYSPDETGAPHFRNDPATADELALVESLRTEVGL